MFLLPLFQPIHSAISGAEFTYNVNLNMTQTRSILSNEKSNALSVFHGVAVTTLVDVDCICCTTEMLINLIIQLGCMKN